MDRTYDTFNRQCTISVGGISAVTMPTSAEDAFDACDDGQCDGLGVACTVSKGLEEEH